MKGLRLLGLTLFALSAAAQQSTPGFRVAQSYHSGQVLVLLTDELKEGVPRPPDRENRPGEPSSVHSASLGQFPDPIRPKIGSRYYVYPAAEGAKVATVEAPVVVEGCSDAWLGVRARIVGSTINTAAHDPDDLRALYMLVSDAPMRRTEAGITPVNPSPAEKQWLHKELTARMLAALPEVEQRTAPSEEIWKSIDANLRRGRFELQTRVEAMRFGSTTRWFLRALFKVGDAAGFLLWAIVQPGNLQHIEHIDFTHAAATRASDWGPPDLISFEVIPDLVGVYQLNGIDYILLRNTGLESFALTLFQYVNGKLIERGTLYSTGC